LRDLETERDVQDAIDFIEACINAGGGDVNPVMGREIKESIERMKEAPFEYRTVTSFLMYINYKDPDSGKPVIHELLGDYLLTGRYGEIFDASSSDLSTDTSFLAIEVEAFMNRGEKCVVPALIYLFNLVEKILTGRLAFLILDEAWLFLKNEKFSNKITEWLKVLRKKNAYVIFATQEAADVANSPLKSTIIQHCMTKIYLADPQAGNLAGVYREFGLTDSEISLIASARMKRDYFYTSPLGRRFFLLDGAASAYEPGNPLCSETLTAKNINYKHLLEKDLPDNPPPIPRKQPVIQNLQPVQISQEPEPPLEAAALPVKQMISLNGEFLDAVASPLERKKSDGSGRAAASVAERFKVSLSTIYKVKKIL
jgi:hypothetical protein